MTQCRHYQGRTMPILINSKETFQNVPRDSLFMCLIDDGYAVVKLNNRICYLTPNLLFCIDNNVSLEILYTYKLDAHSLSFQPEFINRNINWKVINSDLYPSLQKEYNYPSFDLFYKRSQLYMGILPLTLEHKNALKRLFELIICEVTNQPDKYWSCRARAHLFKIFESANCLLQHLSSPLTDHENLIRAVIEYIYIHIGESLSIYRLCNEFHINHTTLCRNFKSLTGLQIGEYVLAKRIHLATEALAFTELKTEEIAYLYGFYDLSHFSRTFKRRMGVTPIQYRKDMQKRRKITLDMEPAAKSDT